MAITGAFMHPFSPWFPWFFPAPDLFQRLHEEFAPSITLPGLCGEHQVAVRQALGLGHLPLGESRCYNIILRLSWVVFPLYS